MPALLQQGFRCCAIDMPGRGKSVGSDTMANRGEMYKSRSEFNLIQKGPAKLVAAVIESLGCKSAHIAGYDWGAGIAMSMAQHKHLRKSVKKICIMLVRFVMCVNSNVGDSLVYSGSVINSDTFGSGCTVCSFGVEV